MKYFLNVRNSLLNRLFIASTVMLWYGSTHGQEWDPQREHVSDKKPEYSPYVDQHFPK